jgi:stringent starvation protein B
MSEPKPPVLTSRRPYLLRAMHEWMVDNQQTPHLVVDATKPDVTVPQQFVQDGKIVLNISYHATNGLTMSNERVEFNARFSGQTHHVNVPMYAVQGIYARETGHGMVFSDDDSPPTPPAPPEGAPDGGNEAGDGAATKSTRSRPQLKVVK